MRKRIKVKEGILTGSSNSVTYKTLKAIKVIYFYKESLSGNKILGNKLSLR